MEFCWLKNATKISTHSTPDGSDLILIVNKLLKNLIFNHSNQKKKVCEVYQKVLNFLSINLKLKQVECRNFDNECFSQVS